jgi:hypothetical protein
MTITTPDGRRWRWYARGLEEHVVEFVVAPDPRDARIAELETALQHIRQLAHCAAELVSVDPAALLETIALLAVDALAGDAQPSATVEEAMAI